MRLDSCLPIFCLRINRDSYVSGSLLPRLNHFDAFFVYAVFKVRRSSSAAFAACPRLQEFLSGSSLLKFWRPPALPHRLQCSTIGRPGLNRRVRHGNGCDPRTHRRQILPATLIAEQ